MPDQPDPTETPEPPVEAPQTRERPDLYERAVVDRRITHETR
jgi:hypothetical protein